MADDSPRALLCLTEGESSLFRVKPAGNTDIIDLKDLIKEQGINSALRAILAKDLILWKVDLAPPSRDGWKGLTGKDAPGSVKLEALNTISDYWPATTPPNPKHLHILIECPSDHAASQLRRHRIINAGTSDLWPAVTTHAIAQGNFGGWASLESNKIVKHTGTEPDFLEQFLNKLQQRWVVSDATPLALVLKDELHHEFGNYFQDAPTGAGERDRDSSKGLLWHFAGAFLFQGWMEDKVKEENVWWIFARLGWHFRSVLGSRANDAYRKDWPFPLIVSTEGKKFCYNPRSYFHVSVDELVHLSVEVQSEGNQRDRYRMLLQAACAARLGRQFYSNPFIVMALYIEETGMVTRYLLFQRDDIDLTVSYVSSVRDWTKPSELFNAMFELYNLALTIPSEVSEGGRIASLKSDLLENFKESFSKRTRDDTGDGLQRGGQVYHDCQVVDAFTRAGYTLESNDEDENGWAPLNQLRPTMRHATRSTGDAVVVKLLRVRSYELEILQHLHSIESPYNHTIPLLDTLKLNAGTFIFLPEATPLELGFAFGKFRNDVLDFSRQLIDGIAYLHSRGIAHLDIKPQNIVAFPKQLFIIDFDIDVCVDGVDALIDRWCGTPEWMAPEIGRQDGPKCSYSPIRADLWSCGLTLQYLASKGAVDNLIEALACRLLNKNPRLRPLLRWQSSFTAGHSLGEGRMKRKRDALSHDTK